MVNWKKCVTVKFFCEHYIYFHGRICGRLSVNMHSRMYFWHTGKGLVLEIPIGYKTSLLPTIQLGRRPTSLGRGLYASHGA